MSDIRFACPFCTQHIACDRSFSGSDIDCPACGARITVPRPVVIVDKRAPISVAFPAPHSTDLGLWSEEAWNAHVRRNPDIYSLDDSRWSLAQLPVVLAIGLPVLVVLGASPANLWTVIIISALISGYVVRRSSVALNANPVFAAMAFVFGLIYYAVLAEVFLLGGCCWPGHQI